MPVTTLPRAALAAAAVLAAGCQQGVPSRAPEPRVPAAGAKRYAPITLAEVHGRVPSPRGARVLLPPSKAAGAEHVIAGYCLDATTLDAAVDAIRAQLAAEGWTGIAVLAQDLEPRTLVAAERDGLSTSVEVVQTPEPACDAPDQIAVGVTVYRVRF